MAQPGGPNGVDATRFPALAQLAQVDEPLDTALPEVKPTTRRGVLSNGMTYFVMRNREPQERVDLALAVGIGSLVEEEHERGVAHILEHLAFSATESFENHGIISMLEGLGCRFGPCTNAYTNFDATVYMLESVPVMEERVEQAVMALSEFAFHIRVSDEDLDKERGPVMEEWRADKNVQKRLGTEHLTQLTKGSRYPDRLPIGLKTVIEGCTAATVREFYKRWYHPSLMAVVAVGDMDPDELVGLIETYFEGLLRVGAAFPCSVAPSPKDSSEDLEATGGSGRGAFLSVASSPAGVTGVSVLATGSGYKAGDELTATLGGGEELRVVVTAEQLADFPAVARPAKEVVPTHEEPRFAVTRDPEISECFVSVDFVRPGWADRAQTLAQVRSKLVEEMFVICLNQRLLMLYMQPGSPFFTASVGETESVRGLKTLSLSATYHEGELERTLEALLFEIRRAKHHGFSEAEVDRARTTLLADSEMAFIERDQTFSNQHLEELISLFLQEAPAPGIEYMARVAKTFVPSVTPGEVQGVLKDVDIRRNTLYKVEEPGGWLRSLSNSRTLQMMRNVVNRVDVCPDEEITLWAETGEASLFDPALAHGEVIPGQIVEKKELGRGIEATSWKLSNGVTVLFKRTDFSDDQVDLVATRWGGLTEVPLEHLPEAVFCCTIASELNEFGHRPEVLSQLLMGRRVEEPSTKLTYYTTRVCGECSPSDLDVLLQLIHLQFISKVQPDGDYLRSIEQRLIESTRNELNDPKSVMFWETNKLTTQDHPFLRPIKEARIRTLDYEKACEIYNDRMSNIDSWTFVLCGNLPPDDVLEQLLTQYIGSIPKEGDPSSVKTRDTVTALLPEFPSQPIVKELAVGIVENTCETSIIMPLEVTDYVDPWSGTELQAGSSVHQEWREVLTVGMVCSLLQTSLLELLRFQLGELYSISVSESFTASPPGLGFPRTGAVTISFVCARREVPRVADLIYEEIQRRRHAGFTVSDMHREKEVQLRQLEEAKRTNGYWSSTLSNAAFSRLFDGDIEEAVAESLEAIRECVDSIDSQRARALLRQQIPTDGRDLAPGDRVLLKDPTPGGNFGAGDLVRVAALHQHQQAGGWFSRRPGVTRVLVQSGDGLQREWVEVEKVEELAPKKGTRRVVQITLCQWSIFDDFLFARTGVICGLVTAGAAVMYLRHRRSQ